MDRRRFLRVVAVGGVAMVGGCGEESGGAGTTSETIAGGGSTGATVSTTATASPSATGTSTETKTSAPTQSSTATPPIDYGDNCGQVVVSIIGTEQVSDSETEVEAKIENGEDQKVLVAIGIGGGDWDGEVITEYTDPSETLTVTETMVSERIEGPIYIEYVKCTNLGGESDTETDTETQEETKTEAETAAQSEYDHVLEVTGDDDYQIVLQAASDVVYGPNADDHDGTDEISDFGQGAFVIRGSIAGGGSDDYYFNGDEEYVEVRETGTHLNVTVTVNGDVIYDETTPTPTEETERSDVRNPSGDGGSGLDVNYSYRPETFDTISVWFGNETGEFVEDVEVLVTFYDESGASIGERTEGVGTVVPQGQRSGPSIKVVSGFDEAILWAKSEYVTDWVPIATILADGSSTDHTSS